MSVTLFNYYENVTIMAGHYGDESTSLYRIGLRRMREAAAAFVLSSYLVHELPDASFSWCLTFCPPAGLIGFSVISDFHPAGDQYVYPEPFSQNAK